jgi:hypothetical protein
MEATLESWEHNSRIVGNTKTFRWRPTIFSSDRGIGGLCPISRIYVGDTFQHEADTIHFLN